MEKKERRIPLHPEHGIPMYGVLNLHEGGATCPWTGFALPSTEWLKAGRNALDFLVWRRSLEDPSTGTIIVDRAPEVPAPHRTSQPKMRPKNEARKKRQREREKKRDQTYWSKGAMARRNQGHK